MPQAPAARLIKTREVATGIVTARFPVDARDVVTHLSGGHEYVPDDTPVGRPNQPVVVEAAAPRTIAEILAQKSYKDLQTLAKKVNVAANLSQTELVLALVPHVEGGVISLEEVAGLPKNPATALPLQFPNAEDGA